MKVLIAEDDLVSRRVLQTTLTKWGYDVVVTSDGVEAWEAIQSEDAPNLVVLDWMMPEMDGIAVCRKIRELPNTQSTYIILLTARGNREDIVTGLQAGADDYVTKPFDRAELRARIQVGVRILELQRNLTAHLQELEEALSQVRQLQGLLPICSYCKKIRNDQNYWQQVEEYITEHSEAHFSHGICPECYEKHISPKLRELRNEEQEQAREISTSQTLVD